MNIRFCPTCDRLFSNYSAAAERRAPSARKLLEKYDAHRIAAHDGREN